MTKLEIRNSKLEDMPTSVMTPVRDFKDLDAWKLARTLRILIYALLKKLPVEERFALNSQLRRAAQSIGANIAEGFGRYSYQENIQFCRQARGSAYEVRDHLVNAADAKFISKAEYTEADALAQRVVQVLNGYMRATAKRQAEPRKSH
ncbi:MAG: four helix bundle protein [Candidatus Acidiferrales bacterium]